MELRGALMVVLALCLASATAAEPVSRGWPTYGGSYANTRYFPGTQIGPHNVASLKLAWKFATGEYGSCETSPIIVGDVLYATTAPTNTVFALDAATGALRWRYTPVVAPAHYESQANRGVAADEGRVFFATLDAQLIALDASSGKPRWTVRIGDPASGLSETMAPLAWNGLVFIGSSGGEYGIRGSFSAYSQIDGRLVWRWYSVSPGWEGRFVASIDGIQLHRDLARERALAVRYHMAWRHGGGPVWMTPALSPAEGAIYLSTGNPSPDHNGEARPGDNLYTDSIVALDARTGRMRWFYQEVPHDLWDYDAASPPVLFDVVTASGRIPAVGEAGKVGFLYIVDRRSGRLIRRSQAFVPQHNLFTPPSAAGQLFEPGIGGGAIAPVAYDPALHSIFVGASALPERLQSEPFKPWPGGGKEWSLGTMVWPENGLAFFSRIDVDTGRIVWRHRVSAPFSGGTLSVPGVFFATETIAGRLDAFDARTGKLLWQVVPAMEAAPHSSLASLAGDLVWRIADVAARLWHREPLHELRLRVSSDAAIHAPPVAYEVRGKEYIAVAGDLMWSKARPNTGSTIYAFTTP